MRFKKTAAVLGALAMASAAGPALAAGGYTVTANGATSGTHAFSATSSGVTFTVHHGSTNQVMTCNDVTVAGTVQAGTSVNPVASITSSTWNGCFFNNKTVKVTPNHSPAWTLTGTGPATTGTNDSVTGSIGSVNAGVSILGGLCKFNVTGSADAAFNENNGTGQTVSVNETAGHLALSGVTFGCFGAVSNGDPSDFVANSPFVVSGAAVPVYLS